MKSSLILAFSAAMLVVVLSQVNEEEKQLCEDNRREREIVSMTKRRPNDCKVICEYSDGNKESYNSREGEMCCDIGAAPTGRCKDGDCPVGTLTG